MTKPPLLIKIFSYFFIIAGVLALMSLLITWEDSTHPSEMSITFLTNEFRFCDHPILFSATSLFIVFASVVGYAILSKKPAAYDLGIIYCIVGLIYFSTLIILKIGLISGQVVSLIIQIGIFGGFLSYLIKNRGLWRKYQQNE